MIGIDDMAINPNIILGIRPPRIEQPDPMEQYSKSLALKGLMGQQELQQMQLQQARQGVEDESATRDAYRASGGETSKVLEALYGRGLYKPAAAVEKSILDKRKTTADIAKDEAATAKSRRDIEIENAQYGASLMSTATDTPSYQSALRLGLTRGVFDQNFVDSLPREYTPQIVEQLKAYGLTMAQRLEDQRGRDQQRETGRHNLATETQTATRDTNTNQRGIESNRIAAGQLGVSQGNLGLSRQRLELERNPSGSAKAPVGYRFTQSGDLEKIPGGPADVKDVAGELKAQQGASSATAKAAVVIGKIDEALGRAGFFSTGLTGETLGRIPGTGAYNLEKTLDTIKANIGFKELADMRAASPTGGALGQITERELGFLQAALASLDKGQDEATLRQNLGQVKTHFENWKAAMQQAATGRGGAGGQWGGTGQPQSANDKPIKIRGDDGFNLLPKGAVYVGPDGVTRRK